MWQFYFVQIFQFLQYDIYFPLSFVFLVILSSVYFSKVEESKKKRNLSLVFVFTIIFFIFWSALLTFWQYQLWRSNPISRYLLPPYQKIDYFLNYAYFHFWRDFFYRLLGSVLLLFLINFLNFIFKRDIFYDEEKILIPILGLFVFFPYNLILVFTGFFMLLLIIIFNFFKKKNSLNERFSFKNYWLFLAWLMLLCAPLILINYKFLQFKP